MFDIITFGSATRDNFLRLKKGSYRILPGRDSLEKQDLCFTLGSKIFIEDLSVFSGGGGTNTACTFSEQGFKTAYVGKVGNDKRGEAIIEDLKRFKVSTSFVVKDKKHPTAYSIILSSPYGDRTILIYRGACYLLEIDDIPWKKLEESKPKWFYLAPLSEKSAQLFEPLVEFAKRNKIKIAVNPGDTQINLKKEILNKILPQIEVLILNEEEAALFCKVLFGNGKEGIRRLANLTKGIVVITRGKKGSIVCDRKYLFSAPTPSILPLEKTGAGDAYGSGFLSGLLQKNDIEYAIQLGTANATSCIQKIGAKNGLLKRGEWGSWPKVKVEKSKL